MRIGYYWPTLDNELIDCNSNAAREFFLDLIKHNLIVFNTKEINSYNFEKKNSISDYIQNRLKNEFESIKWLVNYLSEDTEVKGFALTQKPYQANHQNLFHDNAKLENENFTFDNSFLIERTNNNFDTLYLCVKRSFNPAKVRLVLKTHKGNKVRGIIMINGLSNVNLKASDKVFVEPEDFEISHISQIHLEQKVSYHLSDEDLDSDNIPNELFTTKEQIIELYRDSDIDTIPVEFHNFIRSAFRSELKKYNGPPAWDYDPWRKIPSIIGNKVAADLNYKDNYGNSIKTYFSDLYDFSIEVDLINNSRFYNFYVGTYFSKSKNVYILISSPNIENWLNYNTYDKNDYCDSGEGQIFDCTHRFIHSAEQGKNLKEIEKLEANDKLLDNKREIDTNDYDWGLNWDLYNDELDMDQQDPDFW